MDSYRMHIAPVPEVKLELALDQTFLQLTTENLQEKLAGLPNFELFSCMHDPEF